MPAPEPAQPPDRIRIGAPAPMIDCGRYPAKRTVGEVVTVGADIFRDGHDVLRAVVRYRPPGSSSWHETPMRRVDAELDGDRWEGRLELDRSGRYSWTIEAWTDAFATWRGEIERKIAAGQDDLSGELSEGVVLLAQAAGRASGGPAKQLVEQAASLLGNVAAPAGARRDAALDSTLADVAQRLADRSHATRLDQTLQIDVDRQRARFGSWYELFPRSWGGLAGVAEQIPELAELGFDVLYLPPVHPIGRTNRKGANNALVAAAGDPGSPWAIGDESGGHTALHAELGTFEDFAALVATAGAHGIEIALDFAIQCSADHPWLSEHPEWFHRRPDGTLKYAENPPKTYQDIYNLNFDCEDWRGLWDALAEVVLFWCERGVTIFRVDNPHTKPLAFWEWLIARTREKHPDTLFLAEAFTRATMMRQLAKVGFNQSYTYFTWKSSKHDLVEYVSELAFGGMQDYYRPNFFVNTPDILTDELQHGGPPKFASRLVLAATLSPTYGIYSGFESFERVPVRAGSEEYENSEKYEIKQRRLDGPLLALVSRMNAIRRANPALQQLDNIRFLSTENDALIAYVKRTGDNTLIAVVTLDPVLAQEGVVVVPAGLGLAPVFTVTDLLSGESFDWRIGRNYVRLDPYRVAHLLQVSG
jgi:starch synthase (maltosyl-transferring)